MIQKKQDIHALLSPLLKRVATKHQQNIRKLLKHFPHITISFKDADISKQLTRFLMAEGFQVHTTTEQKPDILLRLIPHGLFNRNIVLLNYQSDNGKALLNLLRGIKEHTPTVSFQNLVPLFITGNIRKNMTVPRSLGAFGIETMIVLPTGLSADQSIDEIFTALSENKLLKEKKSKTTAQPLSSVNEEVEAYKKYLEQAEEMMHKERFEEAIQLFTKAIGLHPDPVSLLERGDVFYRLSQYVNALNDYREAAKLEHSLPTPFSKIASCCFLMAKKDIAQKKEEKAQKKIKLALSYLKQAKDALEKLIKTHKKTPEYIPPSPYKSFLSALVLSAQVPEKIIEDEDAKLLTSLTKEILTSLPEAEYIGGHIDIDVRIDYATLLTRKGEFDKADRLFSEIVQDEPKYARSAYNNFAVELRRAKQYGRAYEIYSLLLEEEGEDEKIIIENLKVAGLNYAITLREEFQTEEAIDVYKKILSHKPKLREWVLCELAMTYLELQNQPEASSRIMEAIYINPSLVSSQRFLTHYADLNNLRQEMIKKLSETT